MSSSWPGTTRTLNGGKSTPSSVDSDSVASTSTLMGSAHSAFWKLPNLCGTLYLPMFKKAFGCMPSFFAAPCARMMALAASTEIVLASAPVSPMT